MLFARGTGRAHVQIVEQNKRRGSYHLNASFASTRLSAAAWASVMADSWFHQPTDYMSHHGRTARGERQGKTANGF